MHFPTLPPADERRFLPAIPAGFAIGPQEPLAAGLRRVTVDEFDRAMRAMATEPRPVAVHEVRKTTKRVRAVLRLVQSELGSRRFRTEDTLLRDTARLLAPLRDADVSVASVASIRVRFEDHLRPATFEEIHHRLAERRRRLFEHTADTDDWQRVAYALRSARARYAAWPVDEQAAQAHGLAVIAHGFSSVQPGLRQTYARGREEMAGAVRRPTADAFHAWRKQARYLRHQVETLSGVFPEVLDGYTTALVRLGEVLGDEHDLAELLRFVAAHTEYLPDPVERSMLVALSQHRRAELQAAAVSVGARIYAERPDRFTRRIGDYWEAWDAAVPVGYST